MLRIINRIVFLSEFAIIHGHDMTKTIRKVLNMHLLVDRFVQITGKDPLNGFLGLATSQEQLAKVTKVKHSRFLTASQCLLSNL